MRSRGPESATSPYRCNVTIGPGAHKFNGGVFQDNDAHGQFQGFVDRSNRAQLFVLRTGLGVFKVDQHARRQAKVSVFSTRDIASMHQNHRCTRWQQAGGKEQGTTSTKPAFPGLAHGAFLDQPAFQPGHILPLGNKVVDLFDPLRPTQFVGRPQLPQAIRGLNLQAKGGGTRRTSRRQGNGQHRVQINGSQPLTVLALWRQTTAHTDWSGARRAEATPHSKNAPAKMESLSRSKY